MAAASFFNGKCTLFREIMNDHAHMAEYLISRGMPRSITIGWSLTFVIDRLVVSSSGRTTEDAVIYRKTDD